MEIKKIKELGKYGNEEENGEPNPISNKWEFGWR